MNPPSQTKARRGWPMIKASSNGRAPANDLIAFFVLEKAMYEISYELANRPSWVDIPLQGVLDLLNRAEAGGNAGPL